MLNENGILYVVNALPVFWDLQFIMLNIGLWKIPVLHFNSQVAIADICVQKQNGTSSNNV